jgi:hypothetical protein
MRNNTENENTLAETEGLGGGMEMIWIVCVGKE